MRATICTTLLSQDLSVAPYPYEKNFMANFRLSVLSLDLMKNVEKLLGNSSLPITDMMTYYAYNLNEIFKSMNDMFEDMQGISLYLSLI